jgi:hypothetical protein
MQWQRDAVEEVSIQEGTTQDWTAEAERTLAAAWGASCGVDVEEVVPRLKKFLAESDGNPWDTALAKYIWQKKKVKAGEVRVPFHSYFQTTRRGALEGWSPTPERRPPTPGHMPEETVTMMKVMMESMVRPLMESMKPSRERVTDELAEDAEDTRRRTKTRKPAEVYETMLEDYGDVEDWPWRKTTRAARHTKHFLESIYPKNFTVKQTIEGFLRDKGLMHSHEGREMILCADVIDKLCLVDGCSGLNSAGVEILCRRLEGHKRSLKFVESKADLAKKKLFSELEDVDLVSYEVTNAALDREVAAERKARAETQKWLTKAATAAGEE